MLSARDTMLQRIRQAVAEGNRAGAVPPLPARGDIAYQGGGDPVQRLSDALIAAGGQVHLVPDERAAANRVVELAQAKAAGRVLLGRGPVIDGLQLPALLRPLGLEIHLVDAVDPDIQKDTFFAADLGVSGVFWAIAETGSLVMATRPHDPRSLSLLPPVHIAIVGRDQLLPDLFDLFIELEPSKMQLPACLSIITGPSKTGDIELKLVTGVHGPGELHVVLIGDCEKQH